MTTDFRLFNGTLIVHAVSKGYKRWPGVLNNLKYFKANTWNITRPDKKLYATIMTTEVSGSNNTKIQKQEWVVTDCEKELELKDNYNNESRLKLSNKTLFYKQGDALYGIVHGQLGSNVIVVAQNSTTPSYVTTHNNCCVLSLLKIRLSVYVKNLSGTKVDPLYDGLQIISSTLTYTQKPGVSNSNFGDAVNDQVLATIMSQCRIFVFGENYHKKVLNNKSSTFTQYCAMSDLDKSKTNSLACELITL